MSATPASDEDLRLACHEAGHVVAAHVLGGRVGAVSIESRRAWRGVAEAAAPRMRSGDLEATDLQAPLVLWKPSVRRFLERSVIIDLAGREAERFGPVMAPGYLPHDPAEARAKKAALVLAGRDRRFLRHGDEREHRPENNDQTKALEGAEMLSRESSGLLLSHLRLETRRLFNMRRTQKLLAALVPELLQHRELGRADVLRILRDADRVPTPTTDTGG